MNSIFQLDLQTQNRLLVAHLLTHGQDQATHFRTRRPARARPATDITPVQRAADPRAADPFGLGAAAGVLLVDGDPDFVQKAHRLAEQLLVRLHHAPDALSAIEVLDARGPEIDVIFINLDSAPPATSEACIQKIRAHPHGQRAPLALMSTRTDLDTRRRAADAGARLFLEKPVDSSEFSHALHQLVTLRRAPRPKVLIVDEDPTFVANTRQVLHAQQIECIWLKESAQILSQLGRSHPDALILNADMGEVSGLSLCRILRMIPRWQDLPVLVISARDDLAHRVAAFEAGGDDFLAKPVATMELAARIQAHIERSELMRQRADRDMLTGLMTRRAFLESLAARLSEVKRQRQPLAFCLLDLDRFKRVNDTHGHIAGDRVLAALGRLLQNRFRVEDLRGRWGGEEFAVVLVNEEARAAQKVLGRIQHEFSQIDFKEPGGESFRVTFSAGIAGFPVHGQEVDTLLKTADNHLYAAKAAGRNRIVGAQIARN